MASTGERFEEAVRIMARLRAPGGCPWDREQTFDTIKKYTLEETYEVFDAIERRDWQDLKEELGDLLLQVLFYAEMAQEAGHFSIDDVVEALSRKLVHRHPHVFGDAEAETSGAVLRHWEAIKRQEKRDKQRRRGGEGDGSGSGASMLDDVPRTMPALLEAGKIGAKTARAGFDWPEIDGLVDKLEEETRELREAVAPARGAEHARRDEIEGEVGDLFFTLVNVARRLQVDPESALRRTNRSFRERFAHMEAEARAAGRAFEDLSPDEMERLWSEAKRAQRRTEEAGSRP